MHDGIAIAIAWPETLCKQAGAWYDIIFKLLRVNKNSYYKVGHAAVVLIEKKSGDCHYFDFGRYHTPFQSGRVRSVYTDHDLEIKTKANFLENGGLENFTDILIELAGNKSCHGSGDLHASYCHINFNKAFSKATKMEALSPIPYGPFIPNGTNCSRFVNTTILAGKPKLLHRFLLAYPKTFSPTPIGNVYALNNYCKISFALVDAWLEKQSHQNLLFKNEFIANL